MEAAASDDSQPKALDAAAMATNEQEVIGMLLAQSGDGTMQLHTANGGTEDHQIAVSLAEGVSTARADLGHMYLSSDGKTLHMVDGQSLQAVTLADGTTAYIQHNPTKDGKLVEGQAIQLEDGTTAYVQAVPADTTTIKEPDPTGFQMSDGQAVQLEDGTTAYIHHAPKGFEGTTVQAVQLEDGTTAYIHTPSTVLQHGEGVLHAGDAGLDNLPGSSDEGVDPTSISALEQYASQVSGADQTVSQSDGAVTSTTITTLPHDDGPSMVPTPTTTSAAALVPDQTHITFEKARILQITQSPGPRTSMKAAQLGEKAFRCEFEGCGRLYTTAHHLKVHERAHTGDRPYKCEHQGCDKAFATGYGLKSHTRTHTGEKPYKCPEETCTKAFKTSGDLQKHVRTHTGERPFKCPFEGCDRSFTTSNIRKVHIRTHTGERPYICNIEGCGRSFASATNFKNHSRIHTGEKPYVCTVQGCGKRFTEYSSLYKHHVVHTHSKPYICNHCGKNYRQTSTLAMHKRTAHGDNEAMEEGEEPAQFYAAPAAEADGEPDPKRPRIQYQLTLTADQAQQSGLPEGLAVVTSADGTMSTQEGQTVTMVTQDGQQITMVTTSEGMAVAADPSTLAAMQVEGVTTTTGDATPVTMVTQDGQQIAMVTASEAASITAEPGSALAAMQAAAEEAAANAAAASSSQSSSEAISSSADITQQPDSQEADQGLAQMDDGARIAVESAQATLLQLAEQQNLTISVTGVQPDDGTANAEAEPSSASGGDDQMPEQPDSTAYPDDSIVG
ncbi:uncharacterized protein LOC144869073 isoform X1 [Branchiostoma floridae x Branchiostoma japonicum]